ncbi:phosphoinositide 3-kinase adapter protein 1 [Cololabis saira]|uniref:phosphoinositide 3-kinase adapter protein 1 n=1 Tax=Cololabis saira TaxID=129043 RepID=UPI002AD4A0C3|nr:phosphoinositide 3-kinase adapter protein 1 [Cololabis saira]
MEERISSPESANPESLSSYELLILHTAEAQEWATYLQQILKSSQKFHRRSILLYAVSSADQLHGYNFENFQQCKCIVLLLSGVFFDILCDHELQGALKRLLYPPQRVVVLLCGVSEDDVMPETFEDWPNWRKLSAEDEPAVYITTILESIADSRRAEADTKGESPTSAGELHITAASPTEHLTLSKIEEVVPEAQKGSVLKDDLVGTKNSTSREMEEANPTCVTIQPHRVLCGEPETLFIILSNKLIDCAAPQVEFSSENEVTKKVQGNVENEYTISVVAPDMPAGLTSLTLYTDQSRVSLRPVTYYTSMGEVSRCLEQAANPLNFICQAFDLTSNTTESLDILLTDSLKSKMPATGLQLFGVRQIEEDNMSACQRNEELPTLLHFAAKFGLKKLTTTLLHCPGALQAYSVRNKHGDYPNTLAEKNGFTDLRHFIDAFVETADMLKCHFEDSIDMHSDAEVYEQMSATSQDIMMKYSGCSEDVYESMMTIDPECVDDLYEEMTAVDANPEEVMLRKFFQAKPHAIEDQVNNLRLKSEEEEKEKDEHSHFDQIKEEEDPYALSPEDIYDTVDANSTYSPAIVNRPPAPVPRPEADAEPEKPTTYISRVFSDRGASESKATPYSSVMPVHEDTGPTYDPYAGMKTPGQRQLICLQERVKVGEITVDEAVQEFKAWQFDNERRATSLRYQQENLKKLRDSITRRHKEREKTGKELDYEISAPLQRNLYWGSNASATFECAVYESAPKVSAVPPPPVQTIQRGSWKTGSTSSTSSSESNRLSTHSNFSYSSGTEPDFEDAVESLPPPPRPPRPFDGAPPVALPRIPPRIPERVPEESHERYISCPTRALPQIPHRQRDAAPPIPRRLR